MFYMGAGEYDPGVLGVELDLCRGAVVERGQPAGLGVDDESVATA